MKTHMCNTQAQLLVNDVIGHTQFMNHQRTLHSSVKSRIDNKRKQQIKIVKNNKKELNSNTKNNVYKLFNNLHKKQYNSKIDNKIPQSYKNCRKILEDKLKRNKYQQYQKIQHQRQLRSIEQRKNNCKNLQQRKKQKYDPIINPTYFMRDKDIKSVSIAPFCKKILNMNKSKGITKKSEYFRIDTPKQQSQEYQENKNVLFQSTIPNYAKKRPISAQPNKNNHSNNIYKSQTTNLPQCTFKAILNHIIDKKLYKDTDIKVLYVRLCYKYGQQKVDLVWQTLMDELQR